MRTKVYGVGVKYNQRIGIDIFRTGGIMVVDCALETLLLNIKTNIAQRISENEDHTLRFVVSGDEFWSSDADPKEICNAIVHVSSESECGEGRILRRGDCKSEALPVCLCLCESYEGSASQSKVSWVFRHDVIDGWRAMRFVFTCAFSEFTLTSDRLRCKRRQASFLENMRSSLQTGALFTCVAPFVCQKLCRISMMKTEEKSESFYAHIICDILLLKCNGKKLGLGALSEILTYVLSEGYFHALPSVKHSIRVGNAVVFDLDSTHGNHMCTKICTVSRKHTEAPEQFRKHMRSFSQKMTDTLILRASRRFTQGKWNPAIDRWIDTKQNSLDILISSIPCTDSTIPGVHDLTVCRERTDWAPSIVYCLGINGKLYLDIYWKVPVGFDKAAFLKSVLARTSAISHHTSLPGIY